MKCTGSDEWTLCLVDEHCSSDPVLWSLQLFQGDVKDVLFCEGGAGNVSKTWVVFWGQILGLRAKCSFNLKELRTPCFLSEKQLSSKCLHFTLRSKIVLILTYSVNPIRKIWVANSPFSANNDLIEQNTDGCSHVTKESLFRRAQHLPNSNLLYNK